MAVIIDLITPLFPSFSVTIGASYEQQACSYKSLFTDTTTINLSQFDRGQVCYEQDSKVLGCGTKGGTVIGDLLAAATYPIKQILTIKDESTGQIIYQEDNDFNIDILEWKPILEMGETESCYDVNQQVTFLPSQIQLNNNVCLTGEELTAGYFVEGITYGYSPDHYASYSTVEQILEYKLYYYDFNTASYIEEGSLALDYGVPSTNPIDYPFTFTPTRLTRYRLEATLTNCCQSVTDIIEFEVCDSITVKSSCEGLLECDSCETYYIDNATSNDVVVTIKDGILNKQIHQVTIPATSRVEQTFNEDGVYILSYTIDGVTKSIVLNIQCQIDECYTTLLRAQLCKEVDSTDCCDDRNLGSRIAEIQPLYQTYMHKVAIYTDLSLRFIQSDITNMLNDFVKIGKIRDQILLFCERCRLNCNGCFELKDSCI